MVEMAGQDRASAAPLRDDNESPVAVKRSPATAELARAVVSGARGASTQPPAPMKAKAQKVTRHATVVARQALGSDMVRVWAAVGSDEPMPELPFTDYYIKILFPPRGANYSWPFDPERIRSELERDQWPVTRTYSIRSFDPDTSVMVVDVFVHQGQGDALEATGAEAQHPFGAHSSVAQDWIRDLRPGDSFGFVGPGGKWSPQIVGIAPPESAQRAGLQRSLVFIADEAGIPAVAASLEQVPAQVPVEVFLEVSGPRGEVHLGDLAPEVRLQWVHRGQAAPGIALAQAVRGSALAGPGAAIFLHGNAEMVRDVRRYLVIERGVDRALLSASGYWRHGFTDEQWRAHKREFVAAMELAEKVALGGDELPR